MAKLVNLTIDGTPVTVPEGTLVVNAAKTIGVDIPVFCYHPKMEPVGMCRMCLVEIGRPVIDRATNQPVLDENGKPKIAISPKLETACTTPVSEGMVVIGLSDKAVAGRREILEFLLTSHPLDCPICDKGGECALQDLTMAHGPGRSRFIFDEKMHLAKRIPLGDLIYLDRERCIQCARCVRFQHEIVDDPVINFYQRGRALEIISTSEPGFNSIFSGNTTDICPVGALTTTDFRFEARPWEMKSAASVCSQCPVGCNITYNVRREARTEGRQVIKRVMPRQNEAVNEIWICDKGRFAYHYNASEQRLTSPMVRIDNELVPATWEAATALIAEKMRAAGSNFVALAGGRLSNEDLYALRRLADAQGGKAVLHTYMHGGETTMRTALAQGSNLGALGKGSAILVVACDLHEEAPIWYLRVKQAVDRGATLIVLNARPTKLDKYATHTLRYAYGEEAATLQAFISAQAEPGSAAAAFGAAENTLIFFGSDGLGLEGSQAVAQSCARLLEQTGRVGKPNNGLIPVWAHVNDQGAWDLGLRADWHLAETLAAAGVVYIAAADPAGDDPALAKALERAGFVIAQDLFITPTAALADVVLPATAYTEREGTFTSGERRVQRFYPAVPPREGTLPDFAIIQKIAAALGMNPDAGVPSSLFKQLAAETPGYAGLDYPALSQVQEQWPIVGRGDMYYGGTTYQNSQGLGVQLGPADLPAEDEISHPVKLTVPQGALPVYPISRLYDHGITVTASAILHSHLAGRDLLVHPRTAARFGLVAGAETTVTVNGVTAVVSLRCDDDLPEGIALFPRSSGLPLQAPAVVQVQQSVANPRSNA